MLPWITGELGFMDSLFPQSQFQSLSLRAGLARLNMFFVFKDM